MENTIAVVNSEQCTGCAACAQKCPRDSITMMPDSEGFSHPHVDKVTCITCGLCVDACHVLHAVELANPKDALAVSSSDRDIFDASASGGAFALVARQFIRRRKGIVYGAAFQSAALVAHEGVSTEEDIRHLQNSKYVQSSTEVVFRQVEADLKQGRSVLFSGTGCQVAALKTFLGRTYDSLYSIDIVCHGVPSPLFFQRHVASLCVPERSEFFFRYKGTDLKSKYCLSIEQDGRRVYYKHSSDDTYMNLFMHGISLREACYSCSYARSDRCGDLTLGDVASICYPREAIPRTSLTGVLVNTAKGRELLDMAEAEPMKVYPLNLNQYIQSNTQLNQPPVRPAERDSIYAVAMTEPYRASRLKHFMVRPAIKIKLKNTLKRYIQNRIIRLIDSELNK